ncbi:cleavage and polyadenylation specificity factor subunit 3-II [Histomonas meleagridis]|uniref:cleavage and polyadenylation specificity factor subunit 3-II n=1 Tax=Histomonas meleagridis TaxID=135588 RepID=UPI00355A8D29|nr:cleavage and polyadenylation specificity factor subunit 3-II [Histomonas meleagridis]KAH0804326.1 cleavage and polyadenylation specificity factor subunit 3-II [Histomonas meleagridis]
MCVTCYGAGSEVGRSCILVEISGKRILLDSGVNIGTKNPSKRFPMLPNSQPDVDLVLISHIHTDHLGSLPWLTEIKKCKAPIFMTTASYMLAPIMLRDFLNVTDDPPYNQSQIDKCVSKINYIEFYQHVNVNGINFVAYPAGHILGACAFHVTIQGRSFLYTGDFSSAADHHLPGHMIPRLFPDVLITESTYGNKTREPMYNRERNFVQLVHKCVLSGGKVLIPVFAIGRLQEVCLMLNDYWERIECKIPIYFASGIGAKATEVYRRSVTWMNPTIQSGYFDYGKPTLAYSNVIKYDDTIPLEGPCVMVATSGMLNAGKAYDLLINHHWYKDKKNMLIFTGYCGEGTLGRAILDRGNDNRVKFLNNKDNKDIDIIIQCQVTSVSFSAHADQFEITSMIERLKPHNVITIHGDNNSVNELANKIKKELKIPTHVAKNKEPKNYPEMKMTKVAVDKDCIVNVDGVPSKFSGAIAQENNSGINIQSLKKAADEHGAAFSRIHVKRRLNVNVSKEEVFKVLKNLNFIDENSEFNGDELPLQKFKIDFTDYGLVIEFDLKEKRNVDKFCVMLK